jgi:hypothetical protein
MTHPKNSDQEVEIKSLKKQLLELENSERDVLGRHRLLQVCPNNRPEIISKNKNV